MKTITMEYQSYLAEIEKAKEKGFEEGLEHGGNDAVGFFVDYLFRVYQERDLHALNDFKEECSNYFDHDLELKSKVYDLLESWEISRREGYKEAISNYGIWHNGTQTIGCQQTPVREIIRKIDEGNYFND